MREREGGRGGRGRGEREGKKKSVAVNQPTISQIYLNIGQDNLREATIREGGDVLWTALSRCLHWDIFILVKIDTSQSATEELTEFVLKKRAFERMHIYNINIERKR